MNLSRSAVAAAAMAALLSSITYAVAPSTASTFSARDLPSASMTPGDLATTTKTATIAADERPNILLITTDDQELADMKYMPRTRKLLGEGGVTFANMLSPHPLCCPARAELLTGQFAQNNGVRSNKDRWHGGYAYFNSKNTVATWLHDAGYSTAMVGKYLNQYHAKEAGQEAGWDIWNPTIKNVYNYYDYTMWNNGEPRRYPKMHNADLVADKTVEYIRTLAAKDAPFFVWSSQVAPHGVCDQAQELDCQGPPPGAKRHRDMFKGVRSFSLKSPSFNEKDVSDKSNTIQKLAPVRKKHVNKLFRGRLRSLQAVDEGVAAAVKALKDVGELDNTLILFTSDNGYLLGQHRFVTKNVPYEEALRVPLLVRGPGVPQGVVRDQAVTLVDLAPTIAAAAGVSPNLVVDGSDVLPAAKRARVGTYDTVLIQSGPRKNSEIRYGWAYRGVRTDRYTFVRWNKDKFLELYDRDKDPAQLRNVAYSPAYGRVVRELAHRTRVLKDCSGAGCRRSWDTVPSPRRK